LIFYNFSGSTFIGPALFLILFLSLGVTKVLFAVKNEPRFGPHLSFPLRSFVSQYNFFSFSGWRHVRFGKRIGPLGRGGNLILYLFYPSTTLHFPVLFSPFLCSVLPALHSHHHTAFHLSCAWRNKYIPIARFRMEILALSMSLTLPRPHSGSQPPWFISHVAIAWGRLLFSVRFAPTI